MIRKPEHALMDNRNTMNRSRLCIEWAQVLIALFVPLTIIVYTVMQNNTEISIARENRLQDLKIADERHQQDIMLSNDNQEETTLVQYFNSLGKLLEKNEKLINETNIARFKTLTALAQLKSKRKGFLIRSLIENNLIVMINGRKGNLDISLSDLTGLDLTNNMLVNNEMRCVMLSQTTLTNSSFRRMILRGSMFTETLLMNSDFSSSSGYEWPCHNGQKLGVIFDKAMLDYSRFDDAKHESTSFSGSSLNHARMRRFTCLECTFLNAQMNSTDLSGAEFGSYSGALSIFQKVNMFSTLLYQTKFIYADLQQAIFTMVNATETIFNNSLFSLAIFKNSCFMETIILNSSFFRTILKGSLWYKAKISDTSFFGADMTDVYFINSQCHYCNFNQTQLMGTNFTDSSLDGSDFREANVTYEQLIVARSLRNVFLPNGTFINGTNKN